MCGEFGSRSTDFEMPAEMLSRQEAYTGLELRGEPRLEERGFGITSQGQFIKARRREEASRREKQGVADPRSVLRRESLGKKRMEQPQEGGRSKPGELASATAPAYLHLFYLFCFFHPFFLFWFLFPVISFSCTRSAYNHYRVNFLRNCG